MTVSLMKPDYVGYDPLDAATAAIMKMGIGDTAAAPWGWLLSRSDNILANRDYQRDIAATNASLAQLQREKMRADIMNEAIKVTPGLVGHGIYMGDSPVAPALFGPGGVATGADASVGIRASQAAQAVQRLGEGIDKGAQGGVYFDPQSILDRIGMSYARGPALGAKAGGAGESGQIEYNFGPYKGTVKMKGGQIDEGQVRGMTDMIKRLTGPTAGARTEATAAAGPRAGGSVKVGDLPALMKDAQSKGYKITNNGNGTITSTAPSGESRVYSVTK